MSVEIAYGEKTIGNLLKTATYIYYADSLQGEGASTSPTGKNFIGLYNGYAYGEERPTVESDIWQKYIKEYITWSKYVGEDAKIPNENLYSGTKDFSGKWENLEDWEDTGEVDENLNKIYRIRLTLNNGLYQKIWCRKGETYTLSALVYASEYVGTLGIKYSNVNIRFIASELENEEDTPSTFGENTTVSSHSGISTTPTRLSGVYTTKTDCWLCFRIEATLATGYLNVSSLKLELNDADTGWSIYENSISSWKIHYAFSTDNVTPPIDDANWQESQEALGALGEDEFLWTRTTFYYENGTKSVAYSVGAKGVDGRDGDALEIRSSHNAVYKFQNDTGDIEFSPKAFGFTVYDITDGNEPKKIEFKAQGDSSSRKPDFEIDLVDLNSNVYKIPERYCVDTLEGDIKNPTFYVQNFYSNLERSAKAGLGFLDEDKVDDNNVPKADEDSVLSGSLEAEQVQDLYTAFTDQSALSIRFTYKENGLTKREKIYSITNGTTDEMMKFNVTATKINAAVQNQALIFDSSGLQVVNSGLKIVRVEENKEDETLFEYDSNNGSLKIVGSGTFTGDIYANNGAFNGEINAQTGSIGGFTVKEKTLTSEDGSLILQGGEDSKIIAESIELGTNAKIQKYIELGSGVTLFGESGQNSVLLITDNNGKNTLEISRDGVLTLGDNTNYIKLDGANQCIYSSAYDQSNTGRGWSISNTKSYFNDVIVRGKIESAVFETGKVSAVGGILLIRPSTKIASIETVGGKTLIGLEDNTGFSGTTDNQPEYYYIVPTFTKAPSSGTEDSTFETVDSNGFYCKSTASINKEGKIQIDNLAGSLEEYVGATIVNYGTNGTVGIGINASNNASTIIPRAISVFEWTPQEEGGTISSGFNNKVILGQIPNEPIYGAVSGTYGLYADNAYLTGTLITQDENGSAGISTGRISEGSEEQIMIWAGAEDGGSKSISEAPFRVTRNGKLYASEGVFSGTIKNAIIQTAIIEDSPEDKEALIIKSDTGTVFKNSDGDLIMSVSADGVIINTSLAFGNTTLNKGSFSTSSFLVSSQNTDASLYLSIPSSNESDKRSTISFCDSEIKGDNAQADYEIFESKNTGLNFSAKGVNMMSITENSVNVNTDTIFGGNLIYGTEMRYVQVTDENEKIIGYDLYI